MGKQHQMTSAFCIDIYSIIEDPDLCHPLFEHLISNATTTNTSTYLNAAQASRVRQVFEPLYSINRTLLYPRMQPGSELNAYPSLFSGTPFTYSSDWYKYVVYSDPDWDPISLTLADIDFARAQDPYNISAWDADLSSFKKAGGKLLTYHGMQDQQITSDNSERYYHRLAATMGLTSSELDDFYRYFRIGGMGHCNGGPGAWNIGAYATGGTGGTVLDTPTDPGSNVLMAMVAWVERGEAPEHVRGEKFVNDTVGKGLAFSRRHCRFPARNVYVGPGELTDENAWECRMDGLP
jgi:feruloyl esterase